MLSVWVLAWAVRAGIGALFGAVIACVRNQLNGLGSEATHTAHVRL